ncbi:trehalase isoform X1, partial [Brachionus plicatilis]
MTLNFVLLILVISAKFCHFQLIGGGRCMSKIFCHGQLLHTVQMSGMFPDSKTFVDMPTRHSESEVLRKFSLINHTNFTLLRQFVDENFLPSGSDIISTDLVDWRPKPTFVSRIKNLNLRHLANSLHSRWRKLAKIFDGSNLCSRCKTSAFLSQNAFIVPGGRFIEYYYWDTYWIVEALLVSEMVDTVRGILVNFFDILELNGFIPNGAQIYYLNRSQPPLLIQMVYAYFKHTDDLDFLKSYIDRLDKEYEFWMKHKSVDVVKNGEVFRLNQYRVVS